jgi:hypothetical protein
VLIKILGHWLVIGSENPWVEVILLAEGAEMVTTLEYGYINSTHPKLKSVFLSWSLVVGFIS